MRVVLAPLLLVAACAGLSAPVDDDRDAPVDDGATEDTEPVEDDTFVVDSGDSDPEGFPDPITYLDDPLPGAWSDAFSLPGVAGGAGARVQALAELPDGTLVIGGIFDHVGPLPASNVAVRTGPGVWAELGGGLPFHVEDLLVDGYELWAVGWVSGPDGALGQVARWDGGTWARPAVDLDGRVHGVDRVNDTIYVMGDFSAIGGEAADGLAAVDGVGWIGFDDLFGEDDVGTLRSAFAGRDGELCVTGAFPVVAGQDAGGVACRAGDTWAPWGQLQGEVNGVAQLANGRWMAWGGFALPTEGGLGDVLGLGTWSGSAWVAPDEGGVSGGLVVSVRQLLPQGDSGYAIAGEFGAVGVSPPIIGIVSTFFGVYDGTSWTSVAGGANVTMGQFVGNTVGGYDLLEHDGVLWVGGLFHEAGGQVMVGLGGWDGTSWVNPFDVTLGRGLSGYAQDVAVGIDGSTWVLASNSGRQITLLRWTGSGWEFPSAAPTALRSGSLHVVDGIVHFAGDLTVDLAPCDVAAYVAPERWRCVVTGLGGAVARLGHDDDGNLVLSGEFTPAAGSARVARWDGTSLVALGEGLTEGTLVRMAAAPDGRIAVWGFDLRSGTTELGSLALWDGTAWTPIAGLDGSVQDLAWFDGDLVVAGNFLRHVGGPDDGRVVGSLVRWDGTAWSDLGGLVSGPGNVASTWLVRPWGDGLFVAGDFDRAGTTPLGRLAWFDGTTWASLGTLGPDDLVGELAVGADDVWIVGALQRVDGIPSYGVARWVVGAP